VLAQFADFFHLAPPGVIAMQSLAIGTNENGRMTRPYFCDWK